MADASPPRRLALASAESVVETLAQLSEQDGPEPVTFKGTERDSHLVRLSGEVLLDITKLAPDVYRVARPADARADRLARDHQGDLVDPEACPDGTLMHTGEADLSVLTTGHRHMQGHLLACTWATSAACAAASGLTAGIWSANRRRSPQTIRALLVNSARWTPEILAQHTDRKERLRAVGYGQPQRDIALASTRERPTLILEGRIAEAWPWEIGPEARGRGTVQADRLRTDAASLVGDKHIAIWPTKGWWADHSRTRGDASIAYSLVVTIDAGQADIDLYSLISTRIEIPVDAS
jgi:hypothetical protein